jgi:hypothetical protein
MQAMSMTTGWRLLAAILLASCSGSSGGAGDAGDADADADADSDSDTDADSDTGSDTHVADDFGNGTLSWVVGFGGPEFDGASGIAVMPDDSVVVPCHNRIDAVFGLGQENETLIGERGMSLTHWSADGTLLYARSLAASDWISPAGIAAAADGAILIAGAIVDPVVFGAGEPGETALASHGEADGFLATFDADGDLGWVRRFGGPGEDVGWDVAVTGDGGVLLLGAFLGEAGLDDGTGGAVALAGVAGERNLVLARYSAAGELEWSRTAGALGSYLDHDVIERLTLEALADGSAFAVFGRGEVALVLGEGEPGETVIPASAAGSAVLARFGPDGDLAWAKPIDGVNARFGLSVAAAPDGSAVYVASEFSGTALFGQGAGETTLACAATYDCGVLVRYDGDGGLVWAVPVEAEHWSNLTDVAMAGDGSVAISGAFSGTIGVASTVGSSYPLTARGIIEILIAKYDTDGVNVWAEQAGSESDFWHEDSRAVAGDSTGAVLVTGNYSEKTWFGILEPGETALAPFVPADWDTLDVFLAKYEP